MRAVRVHDYGGPEVLKVEELPTPEPGAGEALVRVEAAGVNFYDVRVRTGDARIGDLPVPVGHEGAGVVEALGSGTDGLEVGDRVAWHWQPGSYSTHALVPVPGMVRLPDTITSEVAASVLLQGLTAHSLACSAWPLQPGDTCLVYSAAGGVGGLLTQMAKARGARVIGAVSHQAKAAAAREVGADEVIVYHDEDVVEAVRRVTGGRGVDVVYDAVGQETFHASLGALRPLGHLISYGQASGPIPPFDIHELAHGGGRFLTRASFLQYVTDHTSMQERSAEIFDWIESGALSLRIAGHYDLGDVVSAHQALDSRTVTGKLLLDTR